MLEHIILFSENILQYGCSNILKISNARVPAHYLPNARRCLNMNFANGYMKMYIPSASHYPYGNYKYDRSVKGYQDMIS